MHLPYILRSKLPFKIDSNLSLNKAYPFDLKRVPCIFIFLFSVSNWHLSFLQLVGCECVDVLYNWQSKKQNFYQYFCMWHHLESTLTAFLSVLLMISFLGSGLSFQIKYNWASIWTLPCTFFVISCKLLNSDPHHSPVRYRSHLAVLLWGGERRALGTVSTICRHATVELLGFQFWWSLYASFSTFKKSIAILILFFNSLLTSIM